MNEEEKYWSLFISGDNDALGKLYNLLFEPLVFVSFYYVKNNEDARDLVSDLFVKLLATSITERKEKWHDVKMTKAYLSKSIRNKSIDFLRLAQNKNTVNLMIDKQLEEPTDPIQSDYFDLLNETEKELFQLHLDGFNNLEIAGKHTINEKTVRNKLSMTRKKIAHFYKNQFLFFL
ncbi:MAG: hypothetical protein RIT10_1232 [Bacteroidota bacterium]|jgi:RNA polymerase sigma factor (sigma-70 family)